MNHSDDQARREAFFSGHVQGVGFRYTTRQIARGFDVTGWVQNLPDGRVQVVAEGAAAEVKAFLQAVEQGMSQYIQGKQVHDAPASGQFNSFEIRH